MYYFSTTTSSQAKGFSVEWSGTKTLGFRRWYYNNYMYFERIKELWHGHDDH